MCDDNIYKASRGSIIQGIYNYIVQKTEKENNNNKRNLIYPIILEYGTYSNLTIFIRLLLENYYYSIAKDKTHWAEAAASLKSMFYINYNDWKDLIIKNYTDFIDLIL